MRRGAILRVTGGRITLLGFLAGGQGCDEAPCLGLRSFGVEDLRLLGGRGVGDLGGRGVGDLRLLGNL